MVQEGRDGLWGKGVREKWIIVHKGEPECWMAAWRGNMKVTRGEGEQGR